MNGEVKILLVDGVGNAVVHARTRDCLVVDLGPRKVFSKTAERFELDGLLMDIYRLRNPVDSKHITNVPIRHINKHLAM